VTEINLDVDFPHSADLVWRAVSDPRLVEEWFALNDLVSEEGCHGHFWPAGLAGLTGPIDVEIVEVTTQRRIKMVWQADQLHAQVTWSLSDVPGGTRLSVAQIGFLGSQGTARRRGLRATYEQVFRENLGAVLDRLAADATDADSAADADSAHLRAAAPVDGARGTPQPAVVIDDGTPSGAEPPEAAVGGESPWTNFPEPTSDPRRRRLVAMLSAVAVVVILGIGLFITVGRPAAGDAPGNRADDLPGAAVPGDNGHPATGSVAAAISGQPVIPGQTPGPNPSGGAVQPTVTTSVSNGVTVTITIDPPSPSAGSSPAGSPATPSPTKTTPPAPAGPLTGNYVQTDFAGGDGYAATVTLRNVVTYTVTDWTVVVELPTLSDVQAVTGATAAISTPLLMPVVVTFTPEAGSTGIAPGTDADISFEAHQVATAPPLSCTVNGDACTGL
jgi:uncharacterized protein YndB with AHSA1/START domain